MKLVTHSAYSILFFNLVNCKLLFITALLIVSSSATSNGYRISEVGEQQPRNLSITGACVLREDRCADDEMSSNTDHRYGNNRSEVC